MKDEVKEFIFNRFGKYCDYFIETNSYWFAKILCDRFTYLDIYYKPDLKLFVAGFNHKYYNCTGECIFYEEPILLTYIKKTCEFTYNQLVSDYIE